MIVDFKTIGKRIRAYRTQRNMTQADLAERLGLSNVYISYIETGVKGISLEVLLKIADEFDVSMDSLVLAKTTARIPTAYNAFAELLDDCDLAEREEILNTASAYKKLRRAENRR